MTIPKQSEMEIPLLREIENAGGKARPADLYDRVATHFPEITQADLKRKLGSHLYWRNRVQWVRQHLVQEGELDGSVPGWWAITEKGRRRLAQHQDHLPGLGTVRTPGVRRSKGTHRQPRIDHDEIARTLEKIGQAFGFDTRWKPKVNDLRPDRKAFQSKRKTLDVSWQVANLAWVPIEVQVGGSVADLIYRFQQVHQWSLRLIVVTVPSHRDEIQEAIHEYPFGDKVIVLSPDEVLKAKRSLDKLLELKAKIFES